MIAQSFPLFITPDTEELADTGAELLVVGWATDPDDPNNYVPVVLLGPGSHGRAYRYHGAFRVLGLNQPNRA